MRRDGFKLTKSGTINIGKVRDHVAADLAADIARQLDAGRDPPTAGRSRAGDIAVLLHSVKDDAPRIQAELAERGIPSVLNAAESVMLSPAARALAAAARGDGEAAAARPRSARRR